MKGSKNLKTLFHQILKEQISRSSTEHSRRRYEGRGAHAPLVIGALKGDSRSLMTLMRIAEQTGEFDGDARNEPLIIRWAE